MSLGHLNRSLFLADYSLKDVQDCTKTDVKIGGAIKAVYVSLGVSVGKCEGILKEIKGKCQHIISTMSICSP